MNYMEPNGNIENHLEVYTLAEVADILRVGRVTAWRMVTNGSLKAFRAGKGWRVLRDDLETLTSGEKDGQRTKEGGGVSRRGVHKS